MTAVLLLQGDPNLVECPDRLATAKLYAVLRHWSCDYSWAIRNIHWKLYELRQTDREQTSLRGNFTDLKGSAVGNFALTKCSQLQPMMQPTQDETH